MADEAVRYETRTVKCVRGMESRSVARWEQDGWEVVSQKQGRLQSELEIRRPVRKISRRTLAIGGGVVAGLIVVIVLGATGVFGGEGDQSDVADGASGTASAPAASRTLASSPTPTPAAEANAEPTAVTSENTPEFAALLQVGDYCDASIDAFATEYEGRTVSFDGSIFTVNNHGSYSTRYDILVGAGDFSTTESRGPAFQFEDVNTTFDLHSTGEVPDAIGEGTNLAVTATVGAYNPRRCLLRLVPVETAFR